MHMVDGLISPAMGIGMIAVSGGFISGAVSKIIKNEENIQDKTIPIMGIMGAFVFTAQMINFTIPATGSSGHIGGGILLAALLGEAPALIVMASILIIQALFFADGGLLALGCNIFNMGVIPCFLIYPFLYRALVKKGVNIKSITIASIVSVVVSLQLGAFGVVLETYFSGVTELPFMPFLMLMQPIHLAIGIFEGIITAGILCFIYNMRSEILKDFSVEHLEKSEVALKTFSKKMVAIFIVISALVGGLLANFVSSNPDGLEWVIEKFYGEEEPVVESTIHDFLADVQETTGFMPDYNFKSTDEEGSVIGTSTAGILGGLITFALAILIGYIIYLTKKKYKAV